MLRRYLTTEGSSRMDLTGNLEKSRKRYLSKSNNNLIHLLKSRYVWMNEFIRQYDVGLELGAGMGASKDFIKSKNFSISDFTNCKWLDLKNIDAHSTNLAPNSLDFIIASNLIHHLAYPRKFFHEAYRILKPEGKLLIQDINTSIIMRFLLKIMRHEGYDESIDVFNDIGPLCDENNLWAANCSIPKLLFRDKTKFEKEFPFWIIVNFKNTEFLQFINSGGVIAKTRYIKLSPKSIKVTVLIDKILCRIFPSIFAMQLRCVLVKTPI